MDARDLFMDQHSAVHSAAVAGNKASAAERAFAGLSEEQMRVRPREDLNSLAWIMWHIARAEDIIVNPVLAGRSQVFDDAWLRRLGIARRDFGIGMTSPEVSELTGQIDLAALREYRDAVGRRTREIVGGFQAEDWGGEAPAAALERAAAEGAFGARTDALVKAFSGRPRAMLLSGIQEPARRALGQRCGGEMRYATGAGRPAEAPAPKEAVMFFELRQYHIRPGQRDNWVKCMEEEIIPFQVKMGMVILGSFVGEEDESVYVWIRRFDNEPERKRLYDAVYQSDYWKNEIAPRVPTMIDREQIKVTRLVATPHSVIQ